MSEKTNPDTRFRTVQFGSIDLSDKDPCGTVQILPDLKTAKRVRLEDAPSALAAEAELVAVDASTGKVLAFFDGGDWLPIDELDQPGATDVVVPVNDNDLEYGGLFNVRGRGSWITSDPDSHVLRRVQVLQDTKTRWRYAVDTDTKAVLAYEIGDDPDDYSVFDMEFLSTDLVFIARNADTTQHLLKGVNAMCDAGIVE